MISPVRCNHCGKTYDLTNVETIHRYSDCTVFKTPCCNKIADDREWKGLPDFKRITNENKHIIKGPDNEIIYLEDKNGF